MTGEAQAALLADGRRCTCSTARSTSSSRRSAALPSGSAAYRQAAARFRTILPSWWPSCRPAAPADRRRRPAGRRARSRAAWSPRSGPIATRFITPMAAVAGAVADEVLAAMLAGRPLRRAYVNNGGDIALHLGAGRAPARRRWSPIPMPAAPHALRLDGTIEIDHAMPVRGLATSGWRGRCFSLGHRRCRHRAGARAPPRPTRRRP